MQLANAEAAKAQAEETNALQARDAATMRASKVEREAKKVLAKAEAEKARAIDAAQAQAMQAKEAAAKAMASQVAANLRAVTGGGGGGKGEV